MFFGKSRGCGIEFIVVYATIEVLRMWNNLYFGGLTWILGLILSLELIEIIDNLHFSLDTSMVL